MHVHVVKTLTYITYPRLFFLNCWRNQVNEMFARFIFHDDFEIAMTAADKTAVHSTHVTAARSI